MNPFHVNNAAPGKCQLRCSRFHEAAETSRTATKPGLSGVYPGNMKEGKRRENSFGVIYLFYCSCSTLEPSSCTKGPPSTSSEQPGLCCCVGSTKALNTFPPEPPNPPRACIHSFDRGDKLKSLVSQFTDFSNSGSQFKEVESYFCLFFCHILYFFSRIK